MLYFTLSSINKNKKQKTKKQKVYAIFKEYLTHRILIKKHTHTYTELMKENICLKLQKANIMKFSYVRKNNIINHVKGIFLCV